MKNTSLSRIRRLGSRVLSKVGLVPNDFSEYAGDFGSWDSARESSSGYDSASILEKTVTAARAVRDGHALWERDSVVFQSPQVNWPVLSCLLRHAARRERKLDVIDFGGAFGSLWWQHRHWLRGIETQWLVVEQAQIAKVGKDEFANETLSFSADFGSCLDAGRPTALLLSGVLPYLEEPHKTLQEIIASASVDTVIFDRTSFVKDRETDRLTVQTVPPTIYEASYPCWFFAKAGIYRHLEREFQLVHEWSNDDAVNIPAEYCGALWERRLS